MTGPGDIAFEPLDFRKRVLTPTGPNQYKVVSSSGEIHEIQADTAYEAFRLSGLSEAIKIERMFIFNRNVIPLEEFSDAGPFRPANELDDAFSSSDEDRKDPLWHFRRRKNPVISAVELDALMRALQAMDMPHPPPRQVADTESGEETAWPVSSSESTTDAPAAQNALASIPVPDLPPAEPSQTSPMGRDIHGDGFDEILPAAMPKPVPAAHAKAGPKPQDALSAEENTIPMLEQPDPLPDRELSSDEINALLSGK